MLCRFSLSGKHEFVKQKSGLSRCTKCGIWLVDPSQKVVHLPPASPRPLNPLAAAHEDSVGTVLHFRSAESR
jgi:hypothetical protein